MKAGQTVIGGKWNADPAADFRRRLGTSAHELGETGREESCPEMRERANGDVAVIGTVIPRSTIMSAKGDIPDA
jgi:hypothetical protein